MGNVHGDGQPRKPGLPEFTGGNAGGGASFIEKEDLPQAVAEGVWVISSTQRVPCAVLSDGQRVFTVKGVLGVMGRSKQRGKRAREVTDNLPPFLAANNLEAFVSPEIMRPTNPVRYVARNGHEFLGYPAEIIPAVCRVYRRAWRAGVLRKDQLPTAEALEKLSDALLGVAIVALIDEATGYQRARPSAELQAKFRDAFLPKMRRWQKTVPDELWQAMAKLAGLPDWRVRPPNWRRIFVEIAYEAFDEDIARHLEQSMPASSSRRRWHQWFKKPVAQRWVQHLWQVIGIAKRCASLRELREEVRLVFTTKPAQRPLRFTPARRHRVGPARSSSAA